MKNSCLFFLALSTFVLSGQVGIMQIPGNEKSITTHGQFYILNYEVPIIGSRYVNELYKKGETVINGKPMTTALMRYDALNEAVEILDPSSQKPRKLLRRKNIKASFDGKTYLVEAYKHGAQLKQGYFNSLNQGSVVLLYRPKKKFIQADTPDHGYEDYKPPTYRDVSEYYIKKGDQPAELLKLRKNKLLKAIGDKTALLKSFIRKHKLNLTKEADVIRLLDYYNAMEIKKEVRMGTTAVAAISIGPRIPMHASF